MKYTLIYGSHRAFTNVPVPPSSAGEVPWRPARHSLDFYIKQRTIVMFVAVGT